MSGDGDAQPNSGCDAGWATAGNASISTHQHSQISSSDAPRGDTSLQARPENAQEQHGNAQETHQASGRSKANTSGWDGEATQPVRRETSPVRQAPVQTSGGWGREPAQSCGQSSGGWAPSQSAPVHREVSPVRRQHSSVRQAPAPFQSSGGRDAAPAQPSPVRREPVPAQSSSGWDSAPAQSNGSGGWDSAPAPANVGWGGSTEPTRQPSLARREPSPARHAPIQSSGGLESDPITNFNQEPSNDFERSRGGSLGGGSVRATSHHAMESGFNQVNPAKITKKLAELTPTEPGWGKPLPRVAFVRKPPPDFSELKEDSFGNDHGYGSQSGDTPASGWAIESKRREPSPARQAPASVQLSGGWGAVPATSTGGGWDAALAQSTGGGWDATPSQSKPREPSPVGPAPAPVQSSGEWAAPAQTKPREVSPPRHAIPHGREAFPKPAPPQSNDGWGAAAASGSTWEAKTVEDEQR
jgi:hypothetical protein